MKNDTCDSSRIRVRRKYCGASVDDLCGSNTEIVETRPCLCPLPDFVATLTTSSLLLPGKWSKSIHNKIMFVHQENSARHSSGCLSVAIETSDLGKNIFSR